MDFYDEDTDEPLIVRWRVAKEEIETLDLIFNQQNIDFILKDSNVMSLYIFHRGSRSYSSDYGFKSHHENRPAADFCEINIKYRREPVPMGG